MTPAEELTAEQHGGTPLTPYDELIAILEGLPLLVREFRRARGLSLRGAAAQAGVPFVSIQRIEAGNKPNVTTVIAMLRWFESGDRAIPGTREDT